jgi:hypothetical protein
MPRPFYLKSVCDANHGKKPDDFMPKAPSTSSSRRPNTEELDAQIRRDPQFRLRLTGSAGRVPARLQ